MKLSEALILRADAQKRIAQLRQRLQVSAMVQEGSTPPEDPMRLLAEMDRIVAEITALIKQINRTNAVTPFDDTRTLTDALADRDALMLERSVIMEVVTVSTVQPQRYSHTELRFIATVDVAALQDRADELARRHRELDTRIQQLNWETDLLEA